MPIRGTQIDTVSRRFAALVKNELSESDIVDMIEANEGNKGTPVCASGDYIDSNEYMMQAMRETTGRDHDGDDEEYCALWNAAWTRAKQYDFYTDENEFRR